MLNYSWKASPNRWGRPEFNATFSIGLGFWNGLAQWRRAGRQSDSDLASTGIPLLCLPAITWPLYAAARASYWWHRDRLDRLSTQALASLFSATVCRGGLRRRAGPAGPARPGTATAAGAQHRDLLLTPPPRPIGVSFWLWFSSAKTADSDGVTAR